MFGNLLGNSQKAVEYTSYDLMVIMGNALAIGIIICLVTFYSQFREYRNHDDNTEKAYIKKGLLLFSMNVIYLTVGLSCVMVLVNNNLARAFSIGAAIALVRFRVKFDQSGQTPAVLFAIISGMACGLGQIHLGWMALGVFCLISVSFTFILELVSPHN